MKSYRTLNVILITICLLMDLYAYIRHNNNKEYSSYPEAVNILKPIDSVIPDSVSYGQFKQLRLQQRIARSIKNGDYTQPSANLIGIMGVGSGVILCDTCTIKGPIEYIPNKPQYYFISLGGWKLKSTISQQPIHDSVIYYVEKGQSYLRKIVVSSEIYDGKKTTTAEVKDVPVKFKYSHKSQTLKIPVCKKTKNTLKSIIITFDVLFGLYALFNVLIFVQLIMSLLGGSSFAMNIWPKSLIALIWFPLFIIWVILRLINLTRSDNNTPVWNADEFAFTTYNIIRLRILAYSITGVSIFFLLLNQLMRIIFSNYFTNDIVLNTAHLYPFWIAMHIGIIFFLILHVFMQGKALKDEQDLTV